MSRIFATYSYISSFIRKTCYVEMDFQKSCKNKMRISQLNHDQGGVEESSLRFCFSIWCKDEEDDEEEGFTLSPWNLKFASD